MSSKPSQKILTQNNFDRNCQVSVKNLIFFFSYKLLISVKLKRFVTIAISMTYSILLILKESRTHNVLVIFTVRIGKMQVLDFILAMVKATTDDKVC